MSEFIKVDNDKLDCPHYGEDTNYKNCDGCIFCTGDQSLTMKGETQFWIKCRYNKAMKKEEVK